MCLFCLMCHFKLTADFNQIGTAFTWILLVRTLNLLNNLFYFYLFVDEVTILTEKHCLGLSKHIATYDTFHKLGIRIGLSENDIDIIKENYRHSVEEQAYQSLLKWKQSNGESARVVTVLNCLMSMGRSDIVDKFCTTCLQWFVERASEEMNYVKMKGKNVNYSDFSWNSKTARMGKDVLYHENKNSILPVAGNGK